MKVWKRSRFKDLDWSKPAAAVDGRYWYRLHGRIAYIGGPASVPLMANPKLHPAIKMLFQMQYRRRLAAYNLAQLEPAPGVRKVDRKTVMQMAQEVGQPKFTRRPPDPSDWVKTAFPSGIAFMPYRAPSTEADVTPHLQTAAVFGSFAAGLIFLLSAGLIWFAKWSSDWYLIALYLSVVIGLAYAWYQWNISTSRARVGWWAMEVARNEDMDGDGYIGEPIKPRSVPIYANDRVEYINMEDGGEGLTASEWRQVAIAILVKHGNISRRGIYDNCKLSQSKSAEAVGILEQGYINEDKSINRAGYDFLIHYLPEHLSPTSPRPTE